MNIGKAPERQSRSKGRVLLEMKSDDVNSDDYKADDDTQ